MLKIDLVRQDREGELIMTGELDAITSPEAETIVNEATGRFDRLILNMEQMTYVSSAGLRVLKRANSTMRSKGGTLLLKKVNKPVMEVLELTGLAVIFKFV